MKINITFNRESKSFLDSLPEKVREKIMYNARKATITVDKDIFKKLQGDIWELRTIYGGLCYRLLAFWDKRNNETTLIVVCNGFIKKTAKTPLSEIEKAERIRKQYFANNN